MSFENSTIIQLRESDSIYRSVYDKNTNKTLQIPTNGDYECIINPTLIEENDVLQLKSCYLDTVSTSDGKIIISDDETNFNMSFYHYILNYDLSSGQKEFNDLKNVNSPQPDGKHYFLCDSFTSTDGRLLDGLAVKTIVNNHKDFGNVHLTFSYTPAGQDTKEPRQKFVFKVPELHGGSGSTIIYLADFYGVDVKFNPNFGFTLDPEFNNLKNLNDPNQKICIDTAGTESANSPANLVKNSAILPSNTGKDAFQFNINFTIPAGSYDPSQLAKIISDKVSKLDINNSRYTEASRPFDNPLLTTNIQFDDKYKVQPEHKVYYVSEDGQDYYRYITDEVFSGTSQFGLEFDEDLNKFKFSIINNPYYADGSSSSAGSIVVESYRHGGTSSSNVNGNSTTDNYFIVNKNSGIVFNSLTPESVWSKKMGFDLSKLCVSPSNVSRSFTGSGGTNTLNLPTFKNIEDGLNVTGSYKGLDIVINKTNLSQLPFPPADPHGQRPLLSENIKALSNNQNIILADSTLQQQSFKYGYYMIQVDIDGVQQKLLSGQYNNNKIQAIISRYYSNESYTSAYTEGSIPFTYKGVPRQLTKFKVRILQPSGELADDIGSDNTVILELIKNKPPKIQALPMPLQQAEFFKEEEKKDKK